MQNINTRDYWDDRFGSGDWEAKGGFSQTRAFAEAQVRRIDLPRDFAGTICDFGCGAGDAFPVYHRKWPKAKLVGVDFSGPAVDLCTKRHGTIARFLQGDYSVVPQCDVIIASNVLEHLDDDKRIAQELKKRCGTLHITVPYREKLKPGGDHVNSYSDDTFDYLGQVERKVFIARGWSTLGWVFVREFILKNPLRSLLRRPVAKQKYQIMFSIR